MEDRNLNLMKPPDWILPDPDNESLTLVRTVFSPDTSHATQTFTGTATQPQHRLAIIISKVGLIKQPERLLEKFWVV